MKILIVGEAGDAAGTQNVLEALAIPFEPPLEPGQTLEHTFTTKYFTQQVGVWIDEHEALGEWVDAYLSSEAAEVRQALGAVIFTSKSPKEASRFAEALDGVLVASTAGYEDDYIVSIEFGELLDAVHSAIADWDGGDAESSPHEQDPDQDQAQAQQLLEPLLDPTDERSGRGTTACDPVDLESISRALKDARLSDMSDAQKRQLAEDLARQLVP